MGIPEILKLSRKFAKKTQTNMASYIGVSSRTYQDYEYGEKKISAKNLIRVILYCKYTDAFNLLDEMLTQAENAEQALLDLKNDADSQQVKVTENR